MKALLRAIIVPISFTNVKNIPLVRKPKILTRLTTIMNGRKVTVRNDNLVKTIIVPIRKCARSS